MPCCALAAAIMGQFLFLWVAIQNRWRRLSGARPAGPAFAAAAEWRFGMFPGLPSRSPSRLKPRVLALALGADLVVLALGGWRATTIFSHRQGEPLNWQFPLCGHLQPLFGRP